MDLQCRSMQYNLVFRGLLEERNEHIETKLGAFLLNEMNISKIHMGNVHRFGKPTKNSPRPIVARFLYYSDLKNVLANANKLRNKSFSISEQFPEAIETVRKTLYPVAKHHRRRGDQVKMVRDRLYINGQQYEPNPPVSFQTDAHVRQPTYSQQTGTHNSDSDSANFIVGSTPAAKRPRTATPSPAHNSVDGRSTALSTSNRFEPISDMDSEDVILDTSLGGPTNLPNTPPQIPDLSRPPPPYDGNASVGNT